jgi:D-lactate dehydrogenase
MKIGVFETKGWQKEYLAEKLKKHKLVFVKGDLNKGNVKKVKDCSGIVVFIGSEVNREILDEIKGLKFIVTMSTGFNHIDLEECKKRKIKVSNVPFYGENTVAEHTFALILALSRKVDQAIDRTRLNDFSIDGLQGFDLKGKTLGVIGVGHIGSHVVKMAKGFEMKVIGFSPKKDGKLARKLGFRYVSFDSLLKNADIITIHCPLNEHTRGMININNMKKIKRGAYLVNTARGEIVDTTALLYALDKGILAGAALDVLEGEEDVKEEELLHKSLNERDMKVLIENHVLLKEKNVIVTPHIAFYTREALQRILDTTLENVKSLVSGKGKNRVC